MECESYYHKNDQHYRREDPFVFCGNPAQVVPGFPSFNRDG